jgi:hypothetical protein
MLALALVWICGSAAVAQEAAAPPRIYTVLFDVTADATGKIDTMTVVGVIDPVTKKPDPAVAAALPPAYIAATRTLFRGHTYKPGDRFYTSNAFDPARPNEAKIVPPDPD